MFPSSQGQGALPTYTPTAVFTSAVHPPHDDELRVIQEKINECVKSINDIQDARERDQGTFTGQMSALSSRLHGLSGVGQGLAAVRHDVFLLRKRAEEMGQELAEARRQLDAMAGDDDATAAADVVQWQKLAAERERAVDARLDALAAAQVELGDRVVDARLDALGDRAEERDRAVDARLDALAAAQVELGDRVEELEQRRTSGRARTAPQRFSPS